MQQEELPIYIVVVAGGQGTRMGMAIPKQFLPLQGKPILYHTLNAFVQAVPQAQIVLVLPEQDISKLQMVLEHFEQPIEIIVAIGGSTRYQSVQNGLKGLPANALVLVHDGVRPFISSNLIQRLLAAAQEYGSAIPAIKVNESMRVLDQKGSSPINRDMLRIVQTPQAFKSELLIEAFRQEDHPKFTDEATVLEHIGHQVQLIEGEKNNIKITTPEDLEWAELLIQRQVDF